MRTGAGLLLIGAGAILAFAVTTNTSVFNLHTAGYVLILVGILGFIVPRRAAGWMGRRLVRRRYGPQQEVSEDVTYSSYATPQDAAQADVEEVEASEAVPEHVPGDTVHYHRSTNTVHDGAPEGTDYTEQTYETEHQR